MYVGEHNLRNGEEEMLCQEHGAIISNESNMQYAVPLQEAGALLQMLSWWLCLQDCIKEFLRIGQEGFPAASARAEELGALQGEHSGPWPNQLNTPLDLGHIYSLEQWGQWNSALKAGEGVLLTRDVEDSDSSGRTNRQGRDVERGRRLAGGKCDRASGGAGEPANGAGATRQTGGAMRARQIKKEMENRTGQA